MKVTTEDVDALARTVYGEARGEPMLGKIAVAHVILNRARKGGWWGSTIRDVCLKPWQFSCWNENDPNRDKLLSVGMDNADFRDCLYAALAATQGQHPDPTDDSTHYYAWRTIARPKWAEGLLCECRIYNHEFFKGVN